ncbi:hypothetical protein [Roseovarius phycicola]|uniref:Uncharacterized protein n=1 Tax=Roseovarius phycicola TaxID=3080976 RepID=A0ABZ2HIB2_9RHOB
MLDMFFLAFVHAFTILLPIFAVQLCNAAAVNAGLTLSRRIWVVGGFATALALWAVVSMEMSRNNLFNVPVTLGDPPSVLIVLFGGALSLWALSQLTHMGRRLTNALSNADLIALQIPRVMGGLFILGWAVGVIPWHFALPAGLGDVWAGLAAWQAWKAARVAAPNARQLILRANIIGMVDFAFAVFFGIITSEGFAHLLAHDTPNIINLHPLAMFPGYFVPLFLGAHLISLSRLRQRDPGLSVPA